MNCLKVNLNINDTGAEVKELQQYLTFLGFYKGNIDGKYGEYTEAGVKRLQSYYDCTSDGNFGSKTCKACGINGQSIDNSIQLIDSETFDNMIERFDEYKKSHKKEANICYIDISNKYRYVSKSKFKDMRKRYEKYIKDHGHKPNGCYVNIPTANNNNSFVTEFKKAVGNFITFKEAYNKIKGRGYIGYNNDIYDQKTALNRLKNRKGLNCSDSCQLMYALAIAMGLTARFVHIKCSNGMGHIQLDVKYPKGVSVYTRIDPAAALSVNSQYAFGRVWCRNGRFLSYNDRWLMSDDGRT